MCAMQDSRDITRTMDLCLRVGEMLLANGAGAADVTATMQALAFHLGLRNPNFDVTFTTLSVSYQIDADQVPLVLIRTVIQRDIDYEDLTRVDHLVRDVLADKVNLQEARVTIARMYSSGHSRKRWTVTAGWGVMCGGVGLMLGGNAWVCAIAFVSAVLIDRLQMGLNRKRLPNFYLQVAGGAVATVLALAASAAGLNLDPSLVVTANIIMLLSGVGFMGGLQDALSGFYITAGARMTEALLSTAGIIAGVSGGLALGGVFGVDIGRLEPGRAQIGTLAVMALGAGICAAAFAFACYSPKRVMIPIGFIAAIGMLIAYSVELSGLGRPWSVALAAFFIGLVSYAVSGRVQVPPLVVVVSGIVPLLPGLSIYRGLSLLSGDDGSSRGLFSIVTAASVAIALASGVILGEYVAQPLKREARKLENRLSGPRLVGPFRARSKR